MAAKSVLCQGLQGLGHGFAGCRGRPKGRYFAQSFHSLSHSHRDFRL